MASPVFRAVATSSTKTVGKPTGTVNGDILVLSAYIENGTAVTFTPPSGFAAIRTEAKAGVIYTGKWWKRAASEGSSYSWTCSPAGSSPLSKMTAYSGCVASGTPWEDADGINGSGASVVLPSVDAGTTDTLIVAESWSFDFGKTNTCAAMTERADVDGNAIYDQDQAATGASGTRTITQTGGADSYTGIIFNLASQSAAPPPASLTPETINKRNQHLFVR